MKTATVRLNATQVRYLVELIEGSLHPNSAFHEDGVAKLLAKLNAATEAGDEQA
jgi:hypothetical protein